MKIAFEHEGKLKILVANLDCGLSLEEIIAKDIPQGAVNVKQLTDDKFPASREFRDAWKFSSDKTKLEVDNAKRDLIIAERAARAAQNQGGI